MWPTSGEAAGEPGESTFGARPALDPDGWSPVTARRDREGFARWREYRRCPGRSRRIGRDDFLDQVPTSGGRNRIPPETLADLLAGLGQAIDAAAASP
jgi:hypothetical protein